MKKFVSVFFRTITLYLYRSRSISLNIIIEEDEIAESTYIYYDNEIELLTGESINSRVSYMVDIVLTYVETTLNYLEINRKNCNEIDVFIKYENHLVSKCSISLGFDWSILCRNDENEVVRKVLESKDEFLMVTGYEFDMDVSALFH